MNTVMSQLRTRKSGMSWLAAGVRAARPDQPQGPRAVGLEFVDVTAVMRASIARYVALLGTG